MPDIVTGKTFVDGEKGITATKMNQIISQAVIQPSFVTSKPSSSTLDPTDQLLEVKGAGTYATITGSQLISSVSAQVDATPQIYSVRLRSWNAVGNPNFEVTQRNCGSLVSTANVPVEDRWFPSKIGTLTYSAQVNISGTSVLVPGTNYQLGANYLRITVTGTEPSLAAGDYMQVAQTVEGPRLRGLVTDVHSFQVIARCSVAGFKFGWSICDPGGIKTITNIGTITAAGVWQLFQFPNLGVWPSGPSWAVTPGSAGYLLRLCLAAGSTYTSPSNGVWNSGNFIGGNGQGNLFGTSGATFDFAFIQHEPGAQCTTPMDPFTQNYDDCLRYFTKSYDYLTKPGTGGTNGYKAFHVENNSSWAMGSLNYPKVLAKQPSPLTIYAQDGTVNAATQLGGSNAAISAIASNGATGFCGINFASAQTLNTTWQFHYASDTGW